jgi:hypothetical protein
MSAVIAQINISSLQPKPKPLSENVIVGKDILELLAGSMYLDPLNVYREYVQNAADAIDEARDAGLNFDGAPGVRISFDHVERTIKIRDNGISIPSSEFSRRLVTIGASQKRGKKLRGFRGIGRLSGLGYCQELIFRGRADGDEKVMEIRWDGRLLREKLRDEHYDGDIAALVKDVVTETRFSGEGFPSRFFEVELRKITRMRSDVLMNEEAVRIYLAQVAPVPFSDEFIPGKGIDSYLEQYGIHPPISVELDDGRGPIFHRIQNYIKLSDTVVDPISSIEHVQLIGVDGEVCAVGWIADHSYSGAIPKKLALGGIRLRAGNIQIGDESILATLFPEPRFAGWAIGDIHVVSQKILPNGRRDDFEPTASYAHLQSELILQAKRITQKIRARSAQRNQLRSVRQHLSAVEVWLQIANEKTLPKLILDALQELSQERLDMALKDASRFPPDSEEGILTQDRLNKLSILVDDLPQNTQHKGSDISHIGSFTKPISAALKTILSNSKSPDAGIGLSLEVLAAIEMAS